MRVRGSSSVFLAISILGLDSAYGQAVVLTPSFDPEQYSASSDPDQIALVDSARVQTMGSYMASLVLHVGGPSLDICVSDAASSSGCQYEGDVVNTRFRADLAFLYGLGKFDVRLVLPTVLYQSTDFPSEMGQPTLSAAGVGDPRIGGRYQLLQRGEFALAADLSFTVPTGGDDFIGNQGLLVDPRVLADWRRDRIAVGVGAGYRYRQDAARFANLYIDDELTWSAAGEYKINDQLSAGLAAYGRIGLMTPDADPMMTSPANLGAEEYPAELMASARYFLTEQIALDAGAGTALSAGYGAVPFRVLAGVQWINRKAPPVDTDADRDRIEDSADKCVHEPEDRDNFEDTDGCPETDNDGDGILDAKDKCANEAEDVDSFQDTDGCPDPDNDADGVLDQLDKCPTQAEDKDGFEDADGCPEGDNDADGILDATDKCPTEAEDKDGFQDDDGCPEADNDKDGLLDGADKCPLEAEVFNGVDDEDGCPDSGGSQVTVTATAVVISDKIFFDTNKAKIMKRSYAVLDAVAGVLKAHTALRVRVEGHTDDRGTGAWNDKLSQDRAESVRAYLVGKGVDASRLEAKGFGVTRPLVQGKDEAARSQNRRVEFVIIDAPAATPAATPAPAAPLDPAP
jgi:outer membrane protein OmpA-like peptidoglycan-associated protein